ncbi:hypothetical protein L6164_026420 [Bauhinia variegata]|uniref:Uncharacterized protein n=1 Tax=Bauhinia variegata TaxID=167791 RepID=A0ACB9LR22_BAUVA|nr:hypothetical protein L6164_026420 [Bauhinia variegata]
MALKAHSLIRLSAKFSLIINLLSCRRLRLHFWKPYHLLGRGIKVFLSIGAENNYNYDIPTAAYAEEFANYLWEHFLGGQHGLLGSATIDGNGIDFFIKHNTPDHVDDLAKKLTELREENNAKFYLSASPNCEYDNEPYLSPAIKNGRFDYIWVQFYNKQYKLCEYDEEYNDPVYLFRTWNTWSSDIPSNSVLFLGLSASDNAVLNGGYIKPEALKNDGLPTIKQASNYGGVMLWNRYYDVLNDPSYSE